MKTKEIRALTQDEMQTKLTESKDKLFKQRLQNSLGQAENPHKIHETRKDIAKLMTILREKEIAQATTTRSNDEQPDNRKKTKS